VRRRTTVCEKRPGNRRVEAGAANAPIIPETARDFERFFEIFADSAAEKKARRKETADRSLRTKNGRR
jgi:hypothetical protein